MRSPAGRWSWVDWAWVAAWMALGLAGRAPLAARIEGLLDHDQAVVGLMALDIAEGRRWPVFFDGQRYMGAVEAYTAAVFVRAWGHSPMVVALAPALFFGLFVAGQYAAWRLAAGRAAGHLAAALAAVGAPLLALWGVAPRGGYSELLAWALPALIAYQAAIRPGGGPKSRLGQAGWGFLLAVGYFLNPLSLVIYATLAVNWIAGRHGADLRQARGLDRPWVRSRWAGAAWAGLGIVVVLILATGCHVELDRSVGRSRHVYLLDLLPERVGPPLGILAVVLTFTALAWWLGAAGRLLGLLAGRPGAVVGALAALSPFLVYNLRVRLGIEPMGLSLPVWIQAPWAIGPNIRDGLFALRALAGCDSGAAAYSLVGQSLDVPPPARPTLDWVLRAWATPLAIVLVGALVATVAWRDRRAWRAFWSLRGRGPTPPTVLALTGLIVSLGLYLLQGSSANSTSIRYLLPAWIFLPGLLAQGLRAWPRAARLLTLVFLLTGWTAAQAQLWTRMDRPCPLRPLARELERREISAIVAPTHLVLLLAELTRGRVGGLEYHSSWPRLHDRFAGRFAPGRPVACVIDRTYGRPASEDLGLRLRALARRHPGRVRPLWRDGPYELWQADVPLPEILSEHEPCSLQATWPRRAVERTRQGAGSLRPDRGERAQPPPRSPIRAPRVLRLDLTPGPGPQRPHSSRRRPAASVRRSKKAATVTRWTSSAT